MPDAATIAQFILALGLGGLILELFRHALTKKDRSTNTTVQVSNNALEWAKLALARAEAAEARADRAQEKAQSATDTAERCKARGRLLESHIDRLEDIMRAANLKPPPIPEDDDE